jgi:hypothetical protein
MDTKMIEKAIIDAAGHMNQSALRDLETGL